MCQSLKSILTHKTYHVLHGSRPHHDLRQRARNHARDVRRSAARRHEASQRTHEPCRNANPRISCRQTDVVRHSARPCWQRVPERSLVRGELSALRHVMHGGRRGQLARQSGCASLGRDGNQTKPHPHPHSDASGRSSQRHRQDCENLPRLARHGAEKQLVVGFRLQARRARAVMRYTFLGKRGRTTA